MAQPRHLKVGSVGRDVRAIQRALKKAGFRKATRRPTSSTSGSGRR